MGLKYVPIETTVDNSCKKCGDVGLVIDLIEKNPEFLAIA